MENNNNSGRINNIKKKEINSIKNKYSKSFWNLQINLTSLMLIKSFICNLNLDIFSLVNNFAHY